MRSSMSSPLHEIGPNSPDESSTRSLLLYTMEMLPDHVLSPVSWRMHAMSPGKNSPTMLSYVVPETNVVVEVTGYVNGQYVVRLLGRGLDEVEDDPPLISMSILGHRADGESYDVPAWKVRETLMEKIAWNKHLD